MKRGNGSAVDSDGEIIDYLWTSSKDGNLSNERRGGGKAEQRELLQRLLFT